MATAGNANAVANSKLTTKVSKLLVDVIASHVSEHTDTVLKAIATEYNLNYEELKEKYGSITPLIDIGRKKKQSKTASANVEGSDTTVEPKKRGRKKKLKEELVETEEYEYEGVTYLVDAENNVYTYNVDAPVLIGTKLIDGRIKMSSEVQ